MVGFLKWSKHLWRALHYMTLQYEFQVQHGRVLPNQHESIITIIENLQHIIDCPKCQTKFADFLNKYPLRDCDKSLFVWTICLHNEVNLALQKPSWEVDTARQFYIDLE